MKVLKAKFPNQKGETLSARLTLPDNNPARFFAIVAHCFTCNKNFNSVRNISEAITNAGFGVLSLDFTGLGNSAGNFSDTNFSTNVDDLVSAAGYLNEKYSPPVLIVGHSFGGPASIYAAAELASIKAVVTVAAPSEVSHVAHLLGDEVEQIEKRGKGTVNVGGQPFTFEKQFLNDLGEHDVLEVVRQLRKPILIMHSPGDTTVEIRHAEMLYKEAKHPKSFISLDGADHLLNNKKDACYTGEVIAAWVKRYLPAGALKA